MREADRPITRGYVLAEGGVAIVPVVGPLVSRSDWLTEFIGAMSYADVREAVEAAVADPSALAVLLEVDSPGGEIGGLFDLVDHIGGLRAASGKPLWAVASESALSATFAIASAADQIYVTRTAEVGSVGILAAHVDESAADAMAGLKWTLIHAGAKKVDGNPHEPLSGSARADLQADVDALYADLVALIARNREIDADAVRATEAAIFRGPRALDVGFADRLGTLNHALADLVDSFARPRSIDPPRRRAASPQLTRRPSAMTTTETPANEPADADPAPPPEAPVTDPAAPAQPAVVAQPRQPEATAETAASSGDEAERLRAEFADIAAVAAQAARLGISVDAAQAMRQGIKPEALRRSVLDTLAERAEATAVVSAAPAAAAGNDSPIGRRARERAAAARKS
jgi:signal peptide peptidase SppA